MSDPVRVLIVAPWGERAGGAEQMLWTILKTLDRSLVEPEVGFLSDGPFVRECAALGVKTWVVPSGRLRNPLAYGRVVVQLSRQIRRSRATIIVAWSAKTHLYLGVARLLSAPHRRNAWWQHGLPSGHWVDRLATLIPATEVGCSSQACAANQARLRPRRSTFVVYPGVDTRAIGSREATRTALGIEPDTWAIGIVGRLQPWKGQDKVIRAIAELRQQDVPAAALVVGGSAFGLSKDYPDELRALTDALGLADNVIFTGQVSDASQFHPAMDAFVSATHGEPFGIAIVEAMAAGLPVVAFASGGPSEIIEDGVSGILVSNDTDLLEALRSLAKDAELAQRLGSGALARARMFGSRGSARSFAHWIVSDVQASKR